MTQVIHRLRRAGCDDRGSATIYFVLMVPAFLGLTALVVDGAGKVQANQQAYSTAAAAARSAANAINSQAIANGGTYIDTARAAGAANAYLSAAGVGGTVAVDGNQITVTVLTAYDAAFLPSSAVEATATAQLITQ